MSNRQTDVIVAGHICLDIIPQLSMNRSTLQNILLPGRLVDVGPAIIATGGAVSNTGLALHKLGNRVKLMGKIGDDPFGDAILQVLKRHDPSLANGMIVSHGEHTSYTIVISPPNMDRIFLHSTGANDTYSETDLKAEMLDDARLFHFGYPPLMKRMYQEQGEHLVELLKSAKRSGCTVSLDMAKPDPESEAGREDWLKILEKALPCVDIFLPSFEEIAYMLRRDEYERWQAETQGGDLLSYASGPLLSEMADELLVMGAAVVGFKLGHYGLYIRTSNQPGRLARILRCTAGADAGDHWINRELFATCFEVNAIGTTGAGDCTIAGFLSGLLHGLSLEETLQTAVGVGACNVEQADATSGIPALTEVRCRMAGGWPKRALEVDLPDWVAIGQGLYEYRREEASRSEEE